MNAHVRAVFSMPSLLSQCVAAGCSGLQRVAAGCSGLQWVAVGCGVVNFAIPSISIFFVSILSAHCVAVSCSVFQSVLQCVLQCVAVM